MIHVGMSAVKIGNMALSHIGHRSRIESFSEASVEAQEISLWYDFCRAQSLAAANWNFARKRQTLTAHAEAAPTNWAFRYQRPVDAIRIRKLVNPNGDTADAVPYFFLNSSDGTEETIVTNLDDAVVEYTFDAQLVSLFTPMFVEALSHLLASKVAYPLTGKQALADKELEKYIVLARMAYASNANEEVQSGPREAEWIRVR